MVLTGFYQPVKTGLVLTTATLAGKDFKNIIRIIFPTLETAHLALHWARWSVSALKVVRCLGIYRYLTSDCTRQSKQKQIRPRDARSWFISSVPTLGCVSMSTTLFIYKQYKCYSLWQSIRNMILAHSLNSQWWMIDKISENQSQNNRQKVITITKSKIRLIWWHFEQFQKFNQFQKCSLLCTYSYEKFRKFIWCQSL